VSRVVQLVRLMVGMSELHLVVERVSTSAESLVELMVLMLAVG
jgi:hypothetical protein